MKRARTILIALAAALAAAAVANQFCSIGNLNDPVGPPVPGIVQGKRAVAYLVIPDNQCGCADPSVQLQRIFMGLHFDTGQVPQQFQVHAGIRPAVPIPGTNSYKPGHWYYESATVGVFVQEPGPFLLEAPAVNARWMTMDQPYFLTITFDSPLDANIMVDGDDQPGIAWISPDGSDWFDMYDGQLDKTSGGKTIIWGDVLCGTESAEGPAGVPGPGLAPELTPPAPNPFNPTTRFTVRLPEAGQATVTVHDTRGRLVRTLADGRLEAGEHGFAWDGRDDRGGRAPAGVYLLRAETPTGVSVQKAAMIK
jgi:hypothetical protein